jgi:hypothetical protein
LRPHSTQARRSSVHLLHSQTPSVRPRKTKSSLSSPSSLSRARSLRSNAHSSKLRPLLHSSHNKHNSVRRHSHHSSRHQILDPSRRNNRLPSPRLSKRNSGRLPSSRRRIIRPQPSARPSARTSSPRISRHSARSRPLSSGNRRRSCHRLRRYPRQPRCRI